MTVKAFRGRENGLLHRIFQKTFSERHLTQVKLIALSQDEWYPPAGGFYQKIAGGENG
jgi:hypothetical protein